MTCPHCGNDDPKMLEAGRITNQLTRITYLCLVCSKTFNVQKA